MKNLSHRLRKQSTTLARSLNTGPASKYARAEIRFIACHAHAFLHSDDRGGALVEMALVLPVLLLLTTGMLVFGIAVNNYLVLTQATANAAQLLAISRGQTLDPCSATASAVYQSAPNFTQNKFTFAFVLNGNAFSGTSCSSASTTTGAAGDLVQGKAATVTVTYPCSLSVYSKNFGSNGCTLTAQTTEIIQ